MHISECTGATADLGPGHVRRDRLAVRQAVRAAVEEDELADAEEAAQRALQVLACLIIYIYIYIYIMCVFQDTVSSPLSAARRLASFPYLRLGCTWVGLAMYAQARSCGTST